MRSPYYKEVEDQDMPGSFTVVPCDLMEMARSYENLAHGGRWRLLDVVFSWATWLREPFGSSAHEVEVSTVFLAIDHDFVESGLPILWETMIFGGPLDEYQVRYRSRAAAINGHAKAIARARAAARAEFSCEEVAL